MNALSCFPRLALALTLSTLGTAASAAEGDYVVQTLGDTSAEVLDDDSFGVYSPSKKPTVAIAGQSVLIRFESADPSVPQAQSLGLGVEVIEDGVASGTFTLTFNGQTTAPSYFNGRLLTASDLSREQSYRPSAARTGAVGYDYTMFNGGVFVGAASAVDGVAPFVLAGLPDGFGAEPVAVAGGHGEQIEIHSFHFGGTTATMDSGESFAVDTVVVRGHEVGHLVTARHDPAVGKKTVSAVGVDSLALDVEAEGSLEAIEALVFDQAHVDVSGNVHDEIGASTPLSLVMAHLPTAGMQQRARFRVAGGAWGAWTSWTSARIDRPMAVPAPGGARVDDYERELRPTVGAPTIAVHGYIKIKKLNSGG